MMRDGPPVSHPGMMQHIRLASASQEPCEDVGDDPLRLAVHTDVSDGIEPVDQLDIEIFQIAEAPPEGEVLADIAERPLDLSLGLGPIRAAGAWHEAIIPCQS